MRVVIEIRWNMTSFKERALKQTSNHNREKRERVEKVIHKESLDSGLIHEMDNSFFNLDIFNP